MRTKSEIATAFDPSASLEGKSRFFLAGIGGAGMSGLAQLLVSQGYSVKGSDPANDEGGAVFDQLRSLNIQVTSNHLEENIVGSDALVISDAIDVNTSPEVSEARKRGVPVFRRSQALDKALRGKKLIAVTGTHGKTTTTAMIGRVLSEAGLDPTVVVGADVLDFGGSVRLGKGEWAVIEACEAYDSFLDFNPQIVVLTNLELDHVDFHGDLAGLEGSVKKFLSRLLADGLLIVSDDEGAQAVSESTDAKRQTYTGLTYPELSPESKLVGRHNRLNAGAAVLVAHQLGIPMETVKQAMEGFQGAERRLQILFDDKAPKVNGRVTVIDDYAHHPTEIAATLQATREAYPGRRIVAVFQPHLYSRTHGQYEAFAHALDEADAVFITDIYPAREKAIPGVSAFLICESLKGVAHYVPSRHLLPREVGRFVKENDVIVAMGAGNISAFAPAFIKELRKDRVRNVLVLFGGDSAEREVSIHSSLEVEKALAPHYNVERRDISDLLLSRGDLSSLSSDRRPDVAVLAVHGSHAEDGAIQGLLELAGIPYTGSGILASALAMDKDRTKKILKEAGVPVGSGTLVRKGDDYPPYEGPCVVKPNAQGSTVGLTFVEHEEEFTNALDRALAYDTEALVEEWLKGREVTVPVLLDRVLPVIEIVPPDGTYDFTSKYTPGMTTKRCPADFPPELTKKMQEYALRAHRALGCAGVTRTDMIVTGEKIAVLEVNTLPGMTSTSLCAISAKEAGLTFLELLETLIDDAVKRNAYG